MKKMLFIFNPYAGRGAVRRHFVKMLQILSMGGYEVTAYPTKGRQDAYRYVKDNGKKYNIITCCGGDGTLNEVVGAVLKKKLNVPIAYIPGGTMNDWGNNLGMSTNMEKSAKIIVSGKPKKFDVGKFNGRRNFNYVAAFGAFSNISYDTRQELKKVIGPVAYGVSALRTLPTLRPYGVEVECDDVTLRGKYLYGMANNSGVIGGFKLHGMDTNLHDGKFEVVLVKNVTNIVEVEILMSALFMKDFSKNKYVDIVRTSKARFKFNTPVKWTLDGEYGGVHELANISLVHDGVKFIVPKDN